MENDGASARLSCQAYDEKRMYCIEKYIDLISDKIDVDADKFQKDILMHIASAMFTEMIAIAYQNSYEDCTDDSSEECLRQSDYIFNNFMEAVTADKGRHRTIGYYAEMLCYTPKYLSTIVKKVCGKNALTLINDNAIEHIIAELKYSDKNIKQIAFDFNFSNNSFFSKFFKMHTGISPTEYRNNIIKNEDGKQRLKKTKTDSRNNEQSYWHIMAQASSIMNSSKVYQNNSIQNSMSFIPKITE